MGWEPKVWQTGGLHGSADDRPCHNHSGDGADGGYISLHICGSCRHGEDCVAVAHGVYRIDGSCVAVVRHLRNFCHLRFVERGVGCDDADGGVRCILNDDAVAVHHRGHGVAESLAIFAASTGANLACLGANDVADGVYCDQSADYDAGISNLDACGAQPRLHGELGAEHLADGCACACANVSFGYGSCTCGKAGFIACIGVGADFEVANSEIHADGGRDDGHYAEVADLVAEVVLLEIANHAARRVEPIGAPTGEQNCLNLLHGVDGRQ